LLSYTSSTIGDLSTQAEEIEIYIVDSFRQGDPYRCGMNSTSIIIIGIIVSVVFGFIIPPGAICEDSEYMIKAAFLLNFARFVDWPEGSFKDGLSPINLLILGADPFGDTLDSIKEKTVKGRQLRIKRGQNVEDAVPCHILFISSSEKEKVSQIVKLLGPVLTVSEIPRFCQQGGMVNFIKVENKIQFEINPEMAKQKRLSISSRLLKLAKIVDTETQKGKQ